MNSSLREMLRNHAVAKARNYRTNSHVDEDKNMRNIKYLVRGGGCSLARTGLSQGNSRHRSKNREIHQFYAEMGTPGPPIQCSNSRV
jgi:hypothetical protein